MKGSVQFCLSVIVVLFPSVAAISYACQCREPQPPCAQYREADAVFIGSVAEIVRAEKPPWFAGEKIRFNVERAFKGVEGRSAQITNGGTSCDYEFREGHNYLVYAYRNTQSGTLITGYCTRTRELAEAAEDIKYIDEGQSSRATVITGILADGQKRLRNVNVIAKLGARVYRAATNDDGWFKLNVSRPDKYVVQIYLPLSTSVVGTGDLMAKISGYHTTRHHHIVEYAVEVKNGECSFIDVPLFIPLRGTKVRIMPSG